ncbi:MAG TPA: Hsp20/alpha crystallin family protein [Burkholderiales bacterium]|nr:Hsp20/alpha crystallin family protein [Burkholderiales bacterium]
MYESLLTFPGGLFEELERLQRDVQSSFGALGLPSSIRAVAQGAFPAINIGGTPTAVEVYAFAPGLDPRNIEVTVDRGVLTVSGERPDNLPESGARRSVYAAERFAGEFRRAVSLPEDVDPGRINATYRDGILRISIARQEKSQPKRIEIK